MKKKIQRVSDKMYLVSVEENTWTSDIKQATEIHVGQIIEVKSQLNKFYKKEETVIV